MKSKQLGNSPSETILVITVGFITLYLFTDWKYALYISAGIGIMGLFSSYAASIIHFLWMKLVWVLSLIMPNVILSIIFFLILTPIAFLSRIFGEKNPLNLKNNSSTLFKTTNKIFSKDSFERPF